MLLTLLHTMISVFQSQRALAIENLALRHQLNVLQRTAKKPAIGKADRLLWVLLSQFRIGWRQSLTIVQPETVIRWHREGFRLYWIREPPSQNWRTFLENHAKEVVSIDIFTVPTATFRVLFVFLILSNHRRQIIHFKVTTNPSAAWTGQQIVGAFPWDSAPRYLIRDRDGIYGHDFAWWVDGMGVEVEPMVGGLHYRFSQG